MEKIIYIITVDITRELEIIIGQQKLKRKLTRYVVNTHACTVELTFESEDNSQNERINGIFDGKDFYDVFVKWNDDKKEMCYRRELTYEEMHKTIDRLLMIRKNHYINDHPVTVYPEYIRVE